MNNKTLLIGTLGTSWAILPELLGFTNYPEIKLFSKHPYIKTITKDLPKIDEIWLATTSGPRTNLALTNIYKWQSLLNLENIIIRAFSPNIEDITNSKDAIMMRELIFRMAFTGTETFGVKNVVYCLAGGRKTMSSDIQRAAELFGGSSIFHIVDAKRLNDDSPETLSNELDENEASIFSPIIVNKNLISSEIVQYEKIDLLPHKSPLQDFISKTQNNEIINILLTETSLTNAIEERQNKAETILNNYADFVNDSEGIPFQALYTLPKPVILSLKQQKIGNHLHEKNKELEWINSLPKTDLHCHLGGIADASELVEIAQATESNLQVYNKALTDCFQPCPQYIQNNLLKSIQSFLTNTFNTSDIKEIFWKVAREKSVPTWAVCAFFIKMFENNIDLLDSFIFNDKTNQANYFGINIKAYEKLGDIQGSSLLQTESAIRAACRVLLKKCKNNNIKYIEVRCSPVNYTRGGLDAVEVAEIISDELYKGMSFIESSLLFIGSRHGKLSDCCRHVELALEILEKNEMKTPLVGFDLAGDEKFDAEQFTPIFKPLFEKCIHITVHAGETQNVDSIWKAVYALNAERIGHGLKLAENDKLFSYFLDRGISIEMCPTSNFQIVGFYDKFLPSSAEAPIYPLADYLKKGLKLSINTDNCGISRTNLTKEFYQAASMTHNGLSKWDVLQIIKNGFNSSFADYNRRKRILKLAEAEIIDLLKIKNC